MAEEIQDGTGNGGYRARVDEFGRLHVNSVSQTEPNNASKFGKSFNVNTGNVTLTSANESALLYLKNEGEENIIISTIGYLLGNSTGGSGDVTARVIKNPNAGTIIDNAANVDIIENKNFGSSNLLDALTYKGDEAETFTNGVNAFDSLIAGAGRAYVIATGDVVLPKGASLGIALTPPTGNSSMDVQVFLALITYP